MSDEVIRELWRVKDDMAREHAHDVRRLAAYLQGVKPAESDRSVGRGAVSQPKATQGRTQTPEPEEREKKL